MNPANYNKMKGTTLDCAFPVIKESLPAGRLGYTSNNRYDGFPPIMNDGRSLIANSRSEPLFHNSLMKSIGTVNNAQYRAYMTKNAKSIIEKDFREASNDAGMPDTGRYVDHIIKDSSVPYLFKSVIDQTVNPRITPNSDLKNIYLSREQLESRRMAPVVSYR